ncbi:Glucan 1,3-beta-glucosidase BGL2 [Yarrowia sp. C11]|nr:Glucan 1,3-beta-glucosidase BGL2 [Yarrowia sp. C11]KAG5363971.1 Glucan 1,3-beta-glucosidase BGL2 [Yarrowia sp. E02]
MKFTFAAVTAALASSAMALGGLGVDLGVKRESDGECKNAGDYKADLEALKGLTDTIRIYAAGDCDALRELGPVAEAANFKLMIGVWPNDDKHFASEQFALKSYLPWLSKSTVPYITVGSEALYRKDMTPQQLADKINEIKKQLKGIKDKNGQTFDVPVGTVDSWNEIVDGYSTPALKAADVVFANAFSYWQGQTMANASYSFFDDIMQALQTIQTVKGTTDIDFWVGETGWPTDGGAFGDSQPGVKQAAQFWQEGICAIRAWGINTLVFEAFDETWKPDTKGDNGEEVSGVEKYWGVYDSNLKPKFDTTCKFD